MWESSEDATENFDVPRNLSELIEQTGTHKRAGAQLVGQERVTKEISTGVGIDDVVPALLEAMRGLGHVPREIRDGDLRYVLLGKQPGGSGDDLEVALAMRPGTTPQPCVLRFLSMEQEAERELRRFRLRAEAHIGMALDHPNVVRVYGYGESGRTPYICRELVDGVNLRELTERSGDSGLSLQAILALTIGISSTLADAHDLTKPDGSSFHVVHGDLSPETILVTRGGSPKLTELSVGHLIGRALKAPTEARAGRPGYMAPEQCFSQSIDHRTDMFALGLIMAELLSGERMVTMTPAELGALPNSIVAVCNSRYRVPAELSGLILKLTSLSPNERPADMHVVANELRALEPTIGPWTRRHQEMHSLLHTSRRRQATLRQAVDGPPPANDGAPVPEVGVLQNSPSLPIGPAAKTDRMPAQDGQPRTDRGPVPLPPADTVRAAPARPASSTERSSSAEHTDRSPAQPPPTGDSRRMRSAMDKAAKIKEAAARAAETSEPDDEASRLTQPAGMAIDANPQAADAEAPIPAAPIPAAPLPAGPEGWAAKVTSGEHPGAITSPAPSADVEHPGSLAAPVGSSPGMALPSPFEQTGTDNELPSFRRRGSLPKALPTNLPAPGDLPMLRKSPKYVKPKPATITGRKVAAAPAPSTGGMPAAVRVPAASSIVDQLDAFMTPGREEWLEPEPVVVTSEQQVVEPRQLARQEAAEAPNLEAEVADDDSRNPFRGPGNGSEFTFLDDDDDSELGSAPLILRAALYGEHAGRMPTLDALEGAGAMATSPELSKMDGLLPLEDEDPPELSSPGATSSGEHNTAVSIAQPSIVLEEDDEDDDDRDRMKTKTVLLLAIGSLLVAASGYAAAWFMLQ